MLLIYSFIQKNDKEYQETKWIPKEGFVPNELTAKRIAEAIWLPIYGDEIINQKPFHVHLISDSVWVVQGVYEEVKIGGTAYIEISKKDCRILKVSHGE